METDSDTPHNVISFKARQQVEIPILVISINFQIFGETAFLTRPLIKKTTAIKTAVFVKNK